MAAFPLHLIAALVATLIGVGAALVLGLAGHLALFFPVVLAGSATGWSLAIRLNPAAAAWVWVPTAIWFTGWAFASYSEGWHDFVRVFVGVGSCGDFACAGQIFVTGPLVGSISYAVASVFTQKRPR